MIVVDDRLLFQVLAHKPSAALREHVAEGIATTSSWYFRLARAMSSGRTEGALSRLMGGLDGAEERVVRSSLADLPDSVLTVDLRLIVPLMTTIASVSAANFLTLEALAVAITLDAAVATTTRSSLLESVAGLVHVPVIAL